MRVLVLKTGSANLASVLASLRRVGVDPVTGDDLAEVQAARHLVLPGVGSFAAAMAAIDAAGLREALRARVQEGRPTLCVCLGLQVLFESSEESPGVVGLSALPGHVRRFPDTVRVPQLGWNRVEPQGPCRLLEPGYACYANSYRLEAPPPGWAWAASDHGGPLVAAIEREGVLACQFHPELSGAWGQSLIARWLEATC